MLRRRRVLRLLTRLGILPRLTFDQDALDRHIELVSRHDLDTASVAEWGHSDEAPT